MVLKVRKLHANATLPTKAHVGDLGYDLYASEYTYIPPDQVTLVPTGIAVRFPSGYGGLIRDRSSIATNRKIFTVAGVIDEGYTGEIKIAFYNPGENDHGFYMSIQPGEKIAQMVLVPVTNFLIQEVDELEETSRGAQGFGSSDVIRNSTG